MQTIYPETLRDLADRWTVLINQINRHEPNHYPDELCMYVAMLARRAEGLIRPDRIEQRDAFDTVRDMVEHGKLKPALHKLHEVIDQRLARGDG